MVVAVGAKTDVGVKRPHNEDNLCVDADHGLYVVCDGMGGSNAGEVASQLAVDTIQKHFCDAQHNANLSLNGTYDPQFSATTNRLASAIRLANQAIHTGAKTDTEKAGMGTTVVAVALNGTVLSVAHVGDSRIYLARGETIQQLTADHSLVAEQVRRGMITEEEAERSPQKNIITRALGVDETVEVDLDEIPLMRGDGVLLCSDGLTRGVTPSEILEVIRREKDPQTASERLVELANAAGGLDNTTVVLVMVHDTAGLSLWQRAWKWFWQ